MPEPSGGYSATAGLPFDAEELESKLVWIWGSHRSGSTWLLEMLCHPLKVDPDGEIGFRWHEGYRGEPVALPIDEFLIAWHVVPAVGTTSENGMVVPKTINDFVGDHSHYAFSDAYADVWRPELRRLTLVRLYAVAERARAAGLGLAGDPPPMVIKEVNASHGADVVMSLFPRSKMIFLTRDGRDVVDSMLDANRGGGWLTRGPKGNYETEEERREFVREAALNWAAQMTICSRAYEDHDPALRRRIGYEDLLADTSGVLEALADWMGLPVAAARIANIAGHHSFDAVPAHRKGPGRFRRSASPGAWRKSLSPDDQAVAQEIMGNDLVKLGYEL